MKRSLWQRFVEWGFGPTEPIRLDLYTRFLALTLLVYVADRAQTPFEWLSNQGYHPSAQFTFPYQPLPAPLLPAWAVLPFLGAFFLCMVLAMIGWRQRLMARCLLVGCVYIFLADSLAAYTLNKIYIAAFLILALAPLPTGPPRGNETGKLQSVWPIRILQSTLIIQYFTAGTCKIFHGDWLRLGFYHGDWVQTHDVLWAQSQGHYCTELCAWMLRELPMWVWGVNQWAGLGFELVGCLLLLNRRTRWIGIVWAVLFQLMIGLTMHKVGYFSFQLAAFLTLFVPPATLERVAERVRTLLSGARRQAPAPSG